MCVDAPQTRPPPTLPARPQVAAELIREHTAQPFDLVFISGDLSYATVDPPNNEIQQLWDAWGRQDEPFASTTP